VTVAALPMTTISQRLAAMKTAPQMLVRRDLMAQWLAEGLHVDKTFAERVNEAMTVSSGVDVVFGSQERPWAGSSKTLYVESLAIARGLHAHGVREGEVIIIQVPNWREGLLCLLAAFHLGLVVVPLMHTAGAADLDFVIESTEASTLIVPDHWKKLDYVARVSALRNIGVLKRIVVIGDGDMPGPVVRWNELWDSRTVALPALTTRSEDVCLINFTSGSTATPKAVVHSHRSLGAEVINFPSLPGLRTRPSFMPLPAGHVSGLLAYLRIFLAAEPTVFMDQWNMESALALLRQYPPEFIGAVPMQVGMLLDAADQWPHDHMRMFLIGGASVPPSLVERAQMLGIGAVRSYGLTEHTTVSGSGHDDPLEKRCRTDGRMMPGNKVRLIDDDGKPAPRGTPGEVLTMGPELCLGYLNQAHSDAAFTEDGWFATGDIGILDEDGFLTVVDRKKDIIIRGGENISSKEIEDILSSQPSVAEVAAVGWPDERYGERPGVFVRLNAGHSLDLDDIRRHFAEAQVLKQKTPEFLVIVDDFPRTPAGKIRKPDLRARVAAMRDQI